MTSQVSTNPYGSGRSTPQRRRVAEAASAMAGAFTIDELAAAVRAGDPATGVATVYRAVTALLGNGWLERVGERDGSALFARCHASGGHHHHVVCDGCGRIEATPCPVLVDSGNAVGAGTDGADPDAFIITRHEVTLYGLCPQCAAEGGTASGLAAKRTGRG